jgi:hypothetical protein
MHVLQSGQQNKGEKIIENKGPCKLGKQGNMVKSFVGVKGTKEKFAKEHASSIGRRIPSCSLSLN